MDEISEDLSKSIYKIYFDEVKGKSVSGQDLPDAEIFFKDENLEMQANAWRKISEYILNIMETIEVTSNEINKINDESITSSEEDSNNESDEESDEESDYKINITKDHLREMIEVMIKENINNVFNNIKKDAKIEHINDTINKL
jgi:hypothetical protein